MHKDEFKNFDLTMKRLIRVSHTDIRAKLDAEKTTKAGKRKVKKPSASGRVSGDKG